jgi:hypothetical protein
MVGAISAIRGYTLPRIYEPHATVSMGPVPLEGVAEVTPARDVPGEIKRGICARPRGVMDLRAAERRPSF